MKKLLLILLAIVALPLIAPAGIPISQKSVPITKVEKTKGDKLSKIDKKKKVKIPFLLKRLIKKFKKEQYVDEGTSGPSTMNWLSLTLAILALLATATGVVLAGIPLAIAAIVLGIIGVRKRRPLVGMGIAGIAIGGGLIFLWVLLVVLLASILL